MATTTAAKRQTSSTDGPAAATSVIAAHGGTGRWLFGWFCSFLVAWLHVLVLNTVIANLTGNAGLVPFVAIFSAAPLATAVFVPQARSGLWRWLVLLMLAGLTSAQFVLVVLVAGEAVLLHRSWVSQRQFAFTWAPAPSAVPTPVKESRRGRRR